jgi:hypothetical protein
MELGEKCFVCFGTENLCDTGCGCSLNKIHPYCYYKLNRVVCAVCKRPHQFPMPYRIEMNRYIMIMCIEKFEDHIIIYPELEYNVEFCKIMTDKNLGNYFNLPKEMQQHPEIKEIFDQKMNGSKFPGSVSHRSHVRRNDPSSIFIYSTVLKIAWAAGFVLHAGIYAASIFGGYYLGCKIGGYINSWRN